MQSVTCKDNSACLHFLAHLYEVKECLCDTPSVCPGEHVIEMFSFCALVSFSVITRDRGFILGIQLHLGKTTESSEPYLMLTYISWFTALRKKCSVSALKSLSR